MSETATNPVTPKIPIRFCPHCKNRPMVVMDMLPCLRTRDGMELRFCCSNCGTSERVIVKPAQDESSTGGAPPPTRADNLKRLG